MGLSERQKTLGTSSQFDCFAFLFDVKMFQHRIHQRQRTDDWIFAVSLCSVVWIQNRITSIWSVTWLEQRTAVFDEPFGRELKDERLRVERLSRIEFRHSLFQSFFFLDSYGVLLYSFCLEKKILSPCFYSIGNQRHGFEGIRSVHLLSVKITKKEIWKWRQATQQKKSLSGC
jgi:hypothetical protein